MNFNEKYEKKILPITNIIPLIPKKDIWIIWLINKETYKIKEFQIYDLSMDGMPYEHSRRCRTFEYITDRMNKISYCDWGANCKGWEQVQLADVFFKFAIQDGFENQEVVKEFLNQLSLVKEWRKDILMYMGFIGMEPYYTYVH